MAVETTSRLRLALLGAAALAACIPLFLAAAVISGGTNSNLPFRFGLLVIALVVTAVVTRRLRVTASIAAALLFVVLVSPLLDSTRVDNEAEVLSAPYGFPFRFVEAELTFTPERYPQTFGWNPWEHPAKLDGLLFLASYASLLAPLLLLTALWRRAARLDTRQAGSVK